MRNMMLVLLGLLITTPAVGQTRWPAFVTSSAVLVAANLYDAETTVQGLRHGLQEGNPLVRSLFGATGDRARIYAVASIPTAGVLVASAVLQKQGRWWWWIPSAVFSGIHLAAGARNQQMLHTTPTFQFTLTF